MLIIETDEARSIRNELLLLICFIYLLIFLDPPARYFFPNWFRGVAVWMAAPVVSVFYFRKELIKLFFDWKANFGIVGFFIYTFLSFIVSFLYDPLVTVQRFILFWGSFLTTICITHSVLQRNSEFVSYYIRLILYLLCSIAFYQAVGYIYGLPFTGIEIYRGRDWYFIPQITSLFSEPAFFALYLVAMLYSQLFVYENKNALPIFLIMVSLVLAQSVAGIISAGLLITYYSVRQIIILPLWDRKIHAASLVRTLVTAVVVFVIVLGANQANIVNNAVNRLEREIGTKVFLIGNSPIDQRVEGSGGMRVINELNFFISTIKEKPLFGYGIAYDRLVLNRPMALNGFVEITVRWGLIGLIMISLILFLEKLRFKSKSNSAFFLFILLYFSIDGAVAKPEFWLPIGFVLLAERTVKFTDISQYRLVAR